MYNVKITNNYIYDITVGSSDTVAKNGGSQQFTNWGSHIITIPGMDEVNCIDLGDKKLDGFPLKETWGALFRYANDEIYYRYEGQGEVEMVIDNLGALTVSTNFSSIVISLPELILDPPIKT